jgi:hypothetical protein
MPESFQYYCLKAHTLNRHNCNFKKKGYAEISSDEVKFISVVRIWAKLSEISRLRLGSRIIKEDGDQIKVLKKLCHRIYKPECQLRHHLLPIN